MRQFKILATALGAALLIAACGGGGDGNQAPRVAFTSVVSFGDSLSDIGTYRVAAGQVAAAGGGRFTINPDDLKTPTVWTELLAVQMGLSSCAARIGGYGVAPAAITGCRNYAQGGARVQNPKGVGNPSGAGDISAALTHPIVTQIANYAADNGSASFTDKQLVTVLAGANDIFGLTDELRLDATAAGTAAGTAAFGPKLVSLLATSSAAASAIGTAMAAAQTAAQAAPGATADSVQLAVVLAAVQAAVANGNTTVLDINGVIGTAQTDASTPAKVGAVMAAAAALTPPVTLTAAQAGGQVFVTSLTTQLSADVPVANRAAAATAISGAFVAAKTAGASDMLAVSAALQAAANAGNPKVSAIIGTTDKTIPGAVGTAMAYAGGVGATAGNTYAANTGAAIAVAGMSAAATTLVGYVKDKIVGMGAKYVVVVNLPDVSLTPSAASSPTTQPLVLAMTTAFNKALQDGLAGTPGVIIVDAFANLQDQVGHPERYGLSNVKDMACDLSKVHSSLVCSSKTLIAGDTSHYLFADSVHPTPYVHKLQAQLVSAYLAKAGWL